ncbi:MAG: hypothetical protein GY784_06585 [Gammaproteobacteria bacterium]|nr:hypothetical protein [Gammaproteobacteria bacterium]
MTKHNYLLRSLKCMGLGIVLLNFSGCAFERLIKVPVKSELATVKDYNTDLHQRSIHIFNPIALDSRVAERRLEPRVDHLFFLVDQSAALSGQYRGVEARLYAREMVRRFMRTMPKQSYSGALLIYHQQPNPRVGGLQVTEYTPNDIDQVFRSAELPHIVEARSLATALNQLSQLIGQTRGTSAVILVTSWSQIDLEVEQAVMRMRQRGRYAEGYEVVASGKQSIPWKDDRSGVCFYTLGVGNLLSRTRLEKVDRCGISVSANKVAQPRDMAHFVQTVLYRGPADSDGDGIFDYQDLCPDTATGRIVDYSGCLRFGPM